MNVLDITFTFLLTFREFSRCFYLLYIICQKKRNNICRYSKDVHRTKCQAVHKRWVKDSKDKMLHNAQYYF